MSQRDNDLIEHILDAASKLAEIVAAGRENFDASWLVLSAAERQLEIIGEAAGKLSEQLHERRPDLPISEARGMRNVIAHEYGDVDYDLLWHTMSASVPQFAASLGKELRFLSIDEAGPEPPGLQSQPCLRLIHPTIWRPRLGLGKRAPHPAADRSACGRATSCAVSSTRWPTTSCTRCTCSPRPPGCADDRAATSEEGSTPPDADRPRVTQQPEPLSPRNRNRVPELSHTYRSQHVKHDPGQHTAY